MKLTINREYAMRHLFVMLLMLGLGCWFGYDGFVRYPATPAAELYRSIEGADAPENVDLEAFKAQKTKTQHSFAFLALLVALVVGVNLFRSFRFQFEFDDEGYAYGGRRRRFGEIGAVDWSRWEKKGIVKVDGITLDSWHHVGVKEFVALLGDRKG